MREDRGIQGRYPRAGAVYDGDPASIAAARDLVVSFLADVQATEGIPVSSRTVDTARLVVSELVTNSVKYAPGPCLLDVATDGSWVEITVWDSDTTLPLARAAEPGRVGQHGLELILALCDGFDIQREPVGKRITTRLSLTADQ
jgi:anti-sigma regulatory factor (Ser/Thr protein kinase)